VPTVVRHYRGPPGSGLTRMNKIKKFQETACGQQGGKGLPYCSGIPRVASRGEVHWNPGDHRKENGPLGCSGRTTLRREQCDIFLGNGPRDGIHVRNNRIASVISRC
jgi:hypothetical protein